MCIQKILQQMISIGLIILFLVGCDATATPASISLTGTPIVPTVTSTLIPSTPTSVPPTSTTLPPTTTSTSIPQTTLSGVKAGHWEGNRSISFDIGTDGNINNFKIEIALGPNICTVTQGKILVGADGAFTFTFGQPMQEDENTVQGKFESDTTVSGSYSKSIFCVAPSGQAFFGITGGDTTWNAEWIEP